MARARKGWKAKGSTAGTAAAAVTAPEPDLEAFFSAGEAGTYDGGPAGSLSPLAVGVPPSGPGTGFDDEDDGAPPPLTSGQLARRDQLRRQVTALVTGLGLASVLALSARAFRGPEEALASSLAARPVDVAVLPAPVVVAPTPTEAPVPASVLAVAALPDEPEIAAEADEIDEVAAPAVAPAVAPKAAAVPVVAARARPSAARTAAPTPASARESDYAASGVGAPPSGQPPPTATFPD